MNSRIKELRKHLNINQENFGTRIGVSRSTIANYETGAREPLDAVVTSICKEFSVNELWLRTGSGEMFRQISREEELANLIGKHLLSCDPSFKHRLISVLLRMSPDEWEMLERKAQELLEETKKADSEESAESH